MLTRAQGATACAIAPSATAHARPIAAQRTLVGGFWLHASAMVAHAQLYVLGRVGTAPGLRVWRRRRGALVPRLGDNDALADSCRVATLATEDRFPRSPNPRMPRLLPVMPDAIAVEPVRMVVLQGTSGCNMNCDYCYLSAESRKTHVTFDLAALRDLFSNIFRSRYVDRGLVVCWAFAASHCCSSRPTTTRRWG